jgi:hypothetical protein
MNNVAAGRGPADLQTYDKGRSPGVTAVSFILRALDTGAMLGAAVVCVKV